MSTNMEELKSQIGTENLEPVETIQAIPQITEPTPSASEKRPTSLSDVVPVEPKPVYISYVKINIYSLVLNVGFKCVCSLLDENQMMIANQDLSIEGEEYNSWTDDGEMTDLILQKLGLSKKVKILS